MTPFNPSVTASQLLGAATWVKSSYSGDTGNNCVEVADIRDTPHGAVAVRDSKIPHGPALLVSPAAWTALVAGVREGSI